MLTAIDMASEVGSLHLSDTVAGAFC